jgi:capsular exopolysaccharide synthesis family protein
MYAGAFSPQGAERPGQEFIYTESLRGLRVAVQLAARADGLRTILIASALENEGKSTVVFNLGLAFREAGQRVGLADTDFERPTLHLVSKTQLTEGLAEAMHARLDPESLASLGDGMWLAPRGQAVRAQTRGIMASNRLKELVGELAEHADIVICDSSPLLLVPESLFLATAVDAVILVVKAGSTKAHELARVRAMLESVGARVIGAVLNEVPVSAVEGYYKRYYKAYVKGRAS